MGCLKSQKFWIILLCAVIVVSAASRFFIMQSPGNRALVYQDGVLIDDLDLAGVSEPFSLEVHSTDGVNILSVETGRIRVSMADCSDGTCVRQGWLSQGVVPIVCLPHRLVVRLDSGNDYGLDAIVG